MAADFFALRALKQKLTIAMKFLQQTNVLCMVVGTCTKRDCETYAYKFTFVICMPYAP